MTQAEIEVVAIFTDIYPLYDIPEGLPRGIHLSKSRKFTGLEDICLIPCIPGRTKNILEQIESRNFTPAPSSYVLGLNRRIKENMQIVSLDNGNIFVGREGMSYIALIMKHGTQEIRFVKRAQLWSDKWLFAVIKKEIFI
ncbi:MAG: hypothetical protein ABIO57_03995 [Candidatus Paceibacterota bacterium]